MRLFYLENVDKKPLEIGVEVCLSNEESRHLLRVNRARADDKVILTDGNGHFLDACLLGEAAGQACLRIDEIRDDALELGKPSLVLACGIVKGKRFEDVLEKAVELGVQRIIPLKTAHAEVDPRSGKQSRWRTLLITAMKQSGRSYLPLLSEVQDLSGFLESCNNADLYFGLARSRNQDAKGGDDLLTPAKLFSGDNLKAECDSIVWLVGPEGGWADQELELLGKRAKAVRLGPYRLRTATASLAGLSLLGPLRENYLRKE